ncbi:hypothetical protein Leryth_019008 [Lithospermum erythrorhizon]|nr:hypothetical protein Leryth_019008 [Lithospermum erythrorhizon]
MDGKYIYFFVLALLALVDTFSSICSANRDFGNYWNNNNDTLNNSGGGSGWPYTHYNATHDAPRRIIVGGDSETWRFGFNYQDWVWRNAPFFFNDTLVFKYDLPNATYGHSVYLMRNYWSMMRCDFRKAKLVGNVSAGAGEGFEFKLKRWMPHYFACGEHDAIHCKSGMMKFVIMPMFHWEY